MSCPRRGRRDCFIWLIVTPNLPVSRKHPIGAVDKKGRGLSSGYDDGVGHLKWRKPLSQITGHLPVTGARLLAEMADVDGELDE